MPKASFNNKEHEDLVYSNLRGFFDILGWTVISVFIFLQHFGHFLKITTFKIINHKSLIYKKFLFFMLIIKIF